MLHTTQCAIITLTLHLFTPGFQVPEAGQVVVKLTFEQLPISLANEAGINTFFRHIDAEYPQVRLILVCLFHNFWFSNY
jgi:hypothetical protein